MRLTISTPTGIVEDVENVHHVRAEDETGAFGILPGHADFVTVLPVSIVTWTSDDDREGYVLIRCGVLTVRGGRHVEIATQGGVREDELQKLGAAALDQFQLADEEEDFTRITDARVHLATMRQIERVLDAARGPDMTSFRLSGQSQPRERSR
jgi:F-type H+-transporting ATPase subunit epsilon